MTLYERCYKGKPDEWEEVTRDYVLDHLDGPYRDPELAISLLDNGGPDARVITPFAIYRKKDAAREHTHTWKVGRVGGLLACACGEVRDALGTEV